MTANEDGGDSPAFEDQALLDRLERAETASTAAISTANAASGAKEVWWSTHSAMTMCSVVLAFGIAVMALSSFLALKRLDKDTILRVVVIPMAIVSAIFLVVAGYTDSQIAPAMGLLGTVVGYVLGTTRSKGTTNDRDSVKNTG